MTRSDDPLEGVREDEERFRFAGGISGVGGVILSPRSAGMTSPGGPSMTSRTGRNTRPLKRPRTIKAVRTKKKYLKKHVFVSLSFEALPKAGKLYLKAGNLF